MKAVSAQVVSCCVYGKPNKIMQHTHGNIPYTIDCWADLHSCLSLSTKKLCDWYFAYFSEKYVGLNEAKRLSFP